MKETDAASAPGGTGATKVPPGRALPSAANPSRLSFGFILVVVQFALLTLLLARFNLETRAFQDVVLIAFCGFLVHHFLPAAWRMPFFLCLSLGATTYVLGLDQRQWHLGLSISRALPLFAIGLLLIGICHLPARLGVRVALLVLAGGVLAWSRSHWTEWSGSADAAWIWPVLGSMFMFRLMVYLYDLQHEKGPVQPVKTLSYFFLLPNVCFTLFPVIDYKTFCRNYYNEEALRIYQRGLEWMTRGIIHLLLWRVIYYEFYVDPSRVSDGADLAQYIVANMGLYLRVSGQFHLVIGLLLLFGFNLPETNRRYFLAAGFTDYWRRVNIYWKDFIMKLFYYPAVFRLKNWGPTWSVVAATAFAFFATWFLHSYQTFWVRDSFSIKSQDLLFWGSLCVLVVLNSLYEIRKGRKRSLGGSVVTWQDDLVLGLRTSATFLLLSVLWSLWSCDSLQQWLELWQLADGDTLLWGALALGVIFVAAVAFEGAWRRPAAAAAARPGAGGSGPAGRVFPWRQALWSCMVTLLLLAVSVQRVHVHMGPTAAAFLANLFETRPNKSDEENMVRGYYEDLMDVGRANPILANAAATQPRDWGMLEKTEIYRETTDYRMYELAPSGRIVLNGHPLSTNRWGMRDQDYDLIKVPGTHRIAMLGSSTVMGLNVDDGESFEALLEARMNRELAGRPYARYEILNFGVNGYNPPTQVVVLDKKVLDFKPDTVIVVVHLQETFFAVQRFARSLRKGIEPVDDRLRQIARDARIDGRTPERQAEQRLMPHWPRLYEWAFGQIAARCLAAGIRPVMVYLPGVEGSGTRRADAELAMDLARKAGFSIVDLERTFEGVAPGSLKVAPWDGHPNALGHKMIADALFTVLSSESAKLLEPVTAVSKQGADPRQ